ncbi:hypothetical protein CRI94_16075 [Longibacter salinarum]|uniref:LysM domain-containing protein n=1 Tax=Longibacter salinarum TaxID=1850348 RepID=A0A2A8CTZ6_9BACT|nr:BON domain-containing protein [Longibacter salinarum]PEN11305.1 hypothetical protein CRI94_16075 [Longibacter salinarum]
MATFDFPREYGVDLNAKTTFGSARAIQKRIEDVVSGQIKDFLVMDEGKEVTLIGEAPSQAVRETAILLAGNVKGTARVNDDALMVQNAETKPEVSFHRVEEGHTLASISEAEYGDAGNAIQVRQANDFLLDGNEEVEPGQTIRLP